MVRSASRTPTPPSATASPGTSPLGKTSGTPASATRAVKRLPPPPPPPQPPPGLGGARGEAARVHGVEQEHRRHVERELRRAPRCHGSLIGEIEVLRRVAAVAHRPVLDQSLGMHRAVLELNAV